MDLLRKRAHTSILKDVGKLKIPVSVSWFDENFRNGVERLMPRIKELFSRLLGLIDGDGLGAPLRGLAVGSTPYPRSLSDLGLIYCEKAGFGQSSRSFSLNSDGYSPQTIETSASNHLALATIA